jgi:hypothetical protein
MVWGGFSYLHLFCSALHHHSLQFLSLLTLTASPSLSSIFVAPYFNRFTSPLIRTFIITAASAMSETNAGSEPNDGPGAHTFTLPDFRSGAVPTSAEARAKRRIAALEEELQTMREGRGRKLRFVAFHLLYYIFLMDRQT